MFNERQFLENKAYELRKWSLIQTTQAGSGHPTSCLSAADIVAVLFFHTMRYRPQDPRYPTNDQFILSKGHASALLYAAWHEVGLVTQQDLLSYRTFESDFEGHPTPRLSFVPAATGSLGMGLSIGAGIAWTVRFDGYNNTTYVLLGDSEISEGSIWEAVQVAAFYKLDHLIAIVDVNNLGQSTQPMYDHEVKKYAHMFEAFGWNACVVDGHNVGELMKTFDMTKAQKNGKPWAVIAKTKKGYGLESIEGKQGFHGKAFSQDTLDDLLNELATRFPDAASYKPVVDWKPSLPPVVEHTQQAKSITVSVPTYKHDEKLATRKVYGEALAGLTTNQVIALDAEVKNSTYAEQFEEKYPDRFIQCFIAEQNMVSMAVGIDFCGKIPFVSTFSAFLTRAHDQLRMAAIGSARLRVIGSHAGVSIGEDGPSQMGLEDLALMRSLPESVVLYPSDAVSAYKLIEQMARYEKGISYLRTTRMDTPIIYQSDEQFVIGGCKVVKQSENDQVCVVAAGITLHEALKAYEQLTQEKKPIHIRIIDLYSVKPLDVDMLVKSISASKNRLLTVEDHYLEGGLGEAVCAELSGMIPEIRSKSLAVREVPRSGKPEQLLAHYQIDAKAIIMHVREIIG